MKNLIPSDVGIMEPVIVIAAGGSGGHVIPAETLAKKLKEAKCHVEILGHNVETNTFFSSEEIKKVNIEASPLSASRFLFFFIKTVKGCFKSYQYLKKLKPSCVVGFGSYHSFPVLCMASWLKIPLVLYEANTVMGKVIKLFAKKASLVASPFDFYKSLDNFIQVEPLIKFAHQPVDVEGVYKEYSFQKDKKILLVLGGSQGSHFLNTEGLDYLIANLDPSQWQVLHLGGHKACLDSIKNIYDKYGIKVSLRFFENQMQKVYQIADLVISRSGATTLFELAHYKKPALLVPFPKASEDHQILNADYYVKHYPAAMIEEVLIDKVDVKSVLERLTSNQDLFKDDTYFIKHTTLDQKVLDLCLKK